MARKISEYMAEAFLQGKPRKRGDNQVRVTEKYVILSYYGYDIARHDRKHRYLHRLEVNVNGGAGGPGWTTATDRLRAIGVQMHSFNGEVFAEKTSFNRHTTRPSKRTKAKLDTRLGFFDGFPAVQPIKNDGWSKVELTREEPDSEDLDGASRLMRTDFVAEWRYWRFRKHRGRTVISLENHESLVTVMGRWWDPSDPHILIAVKNPDLPAKERRFPLSSWRMVDDALLARIEYACQTNPVARFRAACKMNKNTQSEEGGSK